MSAPDTEKPAPIDPIALEEARQALPSDQLVSLIVRTLETLGDPTRLRILYALSRGPLCVRDLALLTDISESGVSHQLRLLRQRRLVDKQRKGNVVYYQVVDQHLAALMQEAEYHADHVLQELPDHPNDAR